MKKILFIFLLITYVITSIFSREVISADWGVEIGYVPRGAYGSWEATGEQIVRFDETYYVSNYEDYDISNTFYTDLSTKIWLMEIFYIGGAINVLMTPDLASTSFMPYFINYDFETGFKYSMGKVDVDIFYYHSCTHPQNTYQFVYRVVSMSGEGSMDKIGLRITSNDK